MIIGIDPGLNGGIVKIKDGIIVEKCIMPTIGSPKKEYDILAIVNILKGANKIILEKAQPRFKDGSKQAFKTGFGFGALQGIIFTLGIPHVLVSPKEWQKQLFAGLPSDDTKLASLMFCQRMWPNEDWTPTERSKKAHDGLTDAACIAYYGEKFA